MNVSATSDGYSVDLPMKQAGPATLATTHDQALQLSAHLIESCHFVLDTQLDAMSRHSDDTPTFSRTFGRGDVGVEATCEEGFVSMTVRVGEQTVPLSAGEAKELAESLLDAQMITHQRSQQQEPEQHLHL